MARNLVWKRRSDLQTSVELGHPRGCRLRCDANPQSVSYSPPSRCGSILARFRFRLRMDTRSPYRCRICSCLLFKPLDQRDIAIRRSVDWPLLEPHRHYIDLCNDELLRDPNTVAPIRPESHETEDRASCATVKHNFRSFDLNSVNHQWL